MRLSSFAGGLHGGDDVWICAATTNIPAHTFTDSVVIWSAGLVEQRCCRHDLAGCTVTALKAIMLEEGRLRGMQLPVSGESLDGRNRIALMHDRQGEAGKRTSPVHVHGAGATLPVVAAFLCAEQQQPFPERIQQCNPRLDLKPMFLAVDLEYDG